MEDATTSDATLSILRKAGLTESQAKGYMALIQHGQLSPVELAQKTDESRTNGYMICEKLESLGLATKIEGKKALYAPAHPSALEALAEKRRKIVMRNEQEVKNSLSPLIDLFFANTEMPGTRTLQGIDGIKHVYTETLSTPDKTILLLRTTADTPDLGLEYLNQYRVMRAKKAIHTYALTPDTVIGRQHQQSGVDEEMLFHRTVLPENAYTAPVEIDVYGSKVAFITFGETQMATIVESPPIAEAMRQLLRLLGAKYQEGLST